MSISLDVLEEQECTHKQGGRCIKAQERLGVDVPVTPNVCNVTCVMHGGPYGGQAVASDVEWLKAMLRYTSRSSIAKVVERYGSTFVVNVPAIAQDVRAAYAHLTAYSWYGGIGLSGSSIVAGAEPRDLDVVLFVIDLRAFYADRDSLVLPSEVSGLKVDLFVKPLDYVGPFAALNLDTMTLYTSRLYATPIVPQGFTVVQTGGEAWAPPQRDPSCMFLDKTSGRRCTIGVMHNPTIGDCRECAKFVARSATPVPAVTPLRVKGKPCSACSRAKRPAA